MYIRLISTLILSLSIGACSWEADSISETNIKTKNMIKQLENDNNSSAFYKWLFSRHGEAPGHQVFITLSQWSYKSPDDFEKLLESLPISKKEEFIMRYSFAVTDTGSDEKYITAFGNNSNEIISIISNKIRTRL